MMECDNNFEKLYLYGKEIMQQIKKEYIEKERNLSDSQLKINELESVNQDLKKSFEDLDTSMEDIREELEKNRTKGYEIMEQTIKEKDQRIEEIQKKYDNLRNMVSDFAGRYYEMNGGK